MGEQWLHEIKYDGYRTQLRIDREHTATFTRNGHDWTHRYLEVVEDGLVPSCERANMLARDRRNPDCTATVE